MLVVTIVNSVFALGKGIIISGLDVGPTKFVFRRKREKPSIPKSVCDVLLGRRMETKLQIICLEKPNINLQVLLVHVFT